MSSYTKKLAYEKIEKKPSKRHFWDRQLYRITEPFEYRTNAGEIIRIEIGFVLDFASVPRLLRWFYPAIGWYAKAVAIHDKTYRNHNGRTKEWADDIMKEGMEVLAHDLTGDVIPKKMRFTIDVFYRTVRKFGSKAWNKNK